MIRTLIGFGLEIERCPATARRLKSRLASRRLYAAQKRKRSQRPRIVFWPVHQEDPKPWKLVVAFRHMDEAHEYIAAKTKTAEGEVAA